MRIVLVGYGRMGQLVGQLAPQYGCEIAGVIDPMSPQHGGGPDDPRWQGVEVAIDFSVAGSVVENVTGLATRGVQVVLGTTGWAEHEAQLRRVVEGAGIGMVAAPNFSTGVVIFESIVAYASKLFAAQNEFGAFLHESHHAAKKDAPSGTALLLKRAVEQAGYVRPIDVACTRVGHVPGTHTVGFDGPAETVTLTHTARDRTAFARGALVAARWVKDRRGWFTMRDVLGVTQ